MKALVWLFRRLSWPYVRRRRLRWALAILAVTLGTALFVSMRVLETSVARSFQRSMRAIAGNADVQVTHGSGIEEEALARIEEIPELKAAPVVQQLAYAPDLERQVLVLGVDFRRDAKMREFHAKRGGLSQIRLLRTRRVIIDRQVARELGLRLYDKLVLSTPHGAQDFEIASYLSGETPPADFETPLLVLSLRGAQRWFGTPGRYDRIDVAGPRERIEEMRRALGPEYSVQDVESMSPLLSYQLRQFRLVLSAVTLLGLLTAAFLIYNSASLSAVERLHEMAIVRALGADRKQILLLMIGEAAIVGLIAAPLGVAAGIGLAKLLLNSLSDGANLLAPTVNIRELTVPRDAWLAAPLLAVLSAVAGSLRPAWSMCRVEPARAIAHSRGETAAARSFVRGVLCCATFVILAVIVGAIWGNDHYGAFACMALGFGGAVLAAPAAIVVLARGIARFLGNSLPVEGRLAIDNILNHPVSASLTVLAFATSLAIVITVSGALSALESQILGWLGRTMTSDLTLQAHQPGQGIYPTVGFPEAAREAALDDPDVERADGFRGVLVPYRGDSILVAAYDSRALNELLQQVSDETLKKELAEGAVAVSENFEHLHLNGNERQIELDTPEGRKSFRVVHVIEDFKWPRGVVFLDREVYRRLWRDDTLSYLYGTLRPGADAIEAQGRLTASLQERFHVFAFRTPEIRDQASGILRQWFQVANAQILVALLIGGFGVANSVLISLVGRKRQWALLAAIGAARGQIQKALVWESLLLGCMSALFGAALGLWMLWWPMVWLSTAEIGFTLDRVFPWGPLVWVAGLGMGVSLLAAAAPVMVLRRLNLASSLGYE